MHDLLSDYFNDTFVSVIIVAVTMQEVDNLEKRSYGALRIFGVIERLFERPRRRS